MLHHLPRDPVGLGAKPIGRPHEAAQPVFRRVFQDVLPQLGGVPIVERGGLGVHAAPPFFGAGRAFGAAAIFRWTGSVDPPTAFPARLASRPCCVPRAWASALNPPPPIAFSLSVL